MKTHFLKTALILATTFFISCSKDDAPEAPPIATIYPQENFWDGFISNGGYSNQMIQSTRMGHLIKFRPKVKGKINSFVIKQPQVGNIAIWLKKESSNNSNNIYDSDILAISTSNTNYVKTITPIELEKDSFYYLIFTSTSSFKYNKTINISPIISGNIEIIGNDFGSNADGGSGFSYFNNLYQPNLNNEMYGNVSFNFQRTE